MSQRLINRSPHLKRLRDEGFDIRITSNVLVVGHVPYVTPKKEVKLGTLVSELKMEGDVAVKPDDHVIRFSGETPCDSAGNPLAKIMLNNEAKDFGGGLTTQHSFSSKPRPEGYNDYYEKITSYVAILLTQAQVIDPECTATPFLPVPADEEESVFLYFDSASSRAEIVAATAKLEIPKIAIIGLGGTGAYVLDLVAKTPVKEIHLYDGDKFHQHNAFRSPGAASLEEMAAQVSKVEYLAAIYSKMRRHIKPHPVHIDETNVHDLRDMAFVFVCIDKGKMKRLIFRTLDDAGVPYADTGMGIHLEGTGLVGIARVTTGTPQQHDHVAKHVSFADPQEENLYSKNIQIADLNALSAALAVIKWKKLCGFYHDLEKEHNTLYTIDGNTLDNTDKA